MYNTDPNAEAITDLRIDVYPVIDNDGVPWTAESRIDETLITQGGQTISEAVDKLLCSLEVLGFKGEVWAPSVGQPDHNEDWTLYQLG